jgi:hypothetical protein
MGEHAAKQILELEPEMRQAMCCYQTSMLQLETGISGRRLHSGEMKEVRRKTWVTPGSN